MLLMFERGIRGGITRVVRRRVQVNNPYMGSDYNPDAPNRYLQYLDANNLYRWVMSQPLSTGGFRWVDIDPSEIGELSTRQDCGYLLEVDVAYPIKLHDKDNELPFMCSGMKIGNVEKLVPKLYCKKRYIIHIRGIGTGVESWVGTRENP